MFGPVLYLEMLLGSRRGKQYVFRWIYAGWLILLYVFASLFYLAKSFNQVLPPFSDGFLSMLLAQHFFLIILVTPAFVAGAITDEKTSGTLQYLMTADLTPLEIVAGKFLGRSAQVLVLALTGVPVICFCGVFGGLDWFRMGALTCYTFLVVFAVGSASILASVLTRTTREAVLSLYFIGFVVVCIYGIGQVVVQFVPAYQPVLAFLDEYVVSYFSPFYVPDHVWKISGPAALGHEMFRAVLIWGGFGTACLTLAVLRLRRSYLRQLEGEGKKKKVRWWRARRQPITADPIRWKERQVEGLAPFAFLRAIPAWMGLLGVFILTCVSSGLIIYYQMPPTSAQDLYTMFTNLDYQKLARLIRDVDESAQYQAGQSFRYQALVVMFLASLVVAIRCSGTISGEREKHTWEALLLTPLETRQLIRGKLWGIIGASHPYLIAYALPAIALSALAGPLALFWTVMWLACTWLAMYYVGAAGIWCSTRSKSSWRSLVGTLGFCYVGGFLVYGPLMLIMVILAFFILLCLLMLDNLLNSSAASNFATFMKYYGDAYYFGMCLALAGVFFGLAVFFLRDAEKRVGALERTRHWENDPDDLGTRRRRRPPEPSVPRYYR